MTVTTTVLGTGISRALFDQSSKLSAALSRKSSESSSPSAPETAFELEEDFTGRINDNIAVRVGSLNASLAATKLGVYDAGATQVLRILGQLQSLISRAGFAGIPDSQLEVINGQFQALRLSINNVPPPPPGNATPVVSVLAGFIPVLPPQDLDKSLGGFDDKKLLGGANLLTPEAIAEAEQTLASVARTIADQRATIGRLKDAIEFAGASVDGAIENQEAAKATLDDLFGNGPSLAELLQQQSQRAQAVQTARLPENILRLLAQ